MKILLCYGKFFKIVIVFEISSFKFRMESSAIDCSFLYPTTVVEENFRKCYCGQCIEQKRVDCQSFKNRCVCSLNSSGLLKSVKRKNKPKQTRTPDKKVLRNEVDWYRHLVQRSKPNDACCSMCLPNRGAKVSLKKLCPRIKALSQPKNLAKKQRNYVKDPQLVSLPGAVKSWPQHCEWLEKNSRPKMYFQPECHHVNYFYFLKFYLIPSFS